MSDTGELQEGMLEGVVVNCVQPVAVLHFVVAQGYIVQ